MSKIEVSRTLVKSPPELWSELEGGVLEGAVGEVRVESTEPERELVWHAEGVSGSAVLEESGWGTKVTLTAELAEAEADVSRAGRWSLWRQPRRPAPEPPAPRRDPAAVERSLEELLDNLGSAHRKKPFSRE